MQTGLTGVRSRQTPEKALGKSARLLIGMKDDYAMHRSRLAPGEHLYIRCMTRGRQGDSVYICADDPDIFHAVMLPYGVLDMYHMVELWAVSASGHRWMDRLH